jgi:mannose-1-phosphate guanylyltransferase
MRVFLLSGGYGKRLLPITKNIPKCLVKLNNKPLLQIWIEKLKDCGYGPFLINTHYLSKKVYNFIDNSKFKKEVKLVHEKKLLGTAGSLIKNVDFFNDEDGLVLHADNYSEENFSNFLKRHNSRPKKCLLTMMTHTTKNPKSCGIVKVNSKKIMIDYIEKPQKYFGDLANCAVYLISNKYLKDLKRKKYTDFSCQVIPKLKEKIFTFQTKNIFLDIGSPENLKFLKKYLSTKSI